MRIRFNMSSEQIVKCVDVAAHQVHLGRGQLNHYSTTPTDLLYANLTAELQERVDEALGQRVRIDNKTIRNKIVLKIVEGAMGQAFTLFSDSLNVEIEKRYNDQESSAELLGMALVKAIEDSANNFLDSEIDELAKETQITGEWELLKREAEMA